MNEKRIDIHRIVEVFFLIVGIASLLSALREIALFGWSSGKDMLFVPAMAFGWYFMRRTVRKRIKR
jgi:hypothetical protein